VLLLSAPSCAERGDKVEKERFRSSTSYSKHDHTRY